MNDELRIMNEDWVECELGEILTVSSGKGLTLKKMTGTGYPVYGGNGINGYHNEYIFEEEKLVVGRVGAKCGATHITKNKSWVTDNALVVNFKTEKFSLKYFQLKLQFEDLNKLSNSTAQPVISGTKIYSYIISIAPLPIQRAIVSKIESLFSDLDNGIANLKKAQEQLKIYRQAVLKKAFEGELTKEWREKIVKTQNFASQLPTTEELLKQIKEERQNHYNKQIEDWKKAVKEWEKNGKEGKKPTKPKVIKEVEPFTKNEVLKLSKLPNNWRWEKLGNIFRVFVGSTPSRKEKQYWENGNIYWVSSGEVAFNKIKATKEKITKLGLLNSSTVLHPSGTVLLAMIGEGKTRGQSAILNVPACHNQNTAAIRVSEINFKPDFLYYYLTLRYERNRRIGSGNNQKALNQGRIMEFDYPICSIPEQHQIVQEIETRLSVCDKVEQNISESLEKAKALRQSILKKAFEGKLLSEAEIKACKQEQDYEPASVLLEKIKTEKVKMQNLASQQKTKKIKRK